MHWLMLTSRGTGQPTRVNVAHITRYGESYDGGTSIGAYLSLSTPQTAKNGVQNHYLQVKETSQQIDQLLSRVGAQLHEW